MSVAFVPTVERDVARRRRILSAAPWCALAILVADAVQQWLPFLRVRVLIGAAATLAAIVGLASWREIRMRPALLVASALAVAAELAVIAAPLVLGAHTSDDSLFASHALVAMLAGWSVVLAIADDGAHAASSVSSREGVRIGALACGVVALLAVWSAYAGAGRPIIVDELLYRLQSRLLEHEGSALTIPPGMQRFFVLRMAFVSPHGLVPQYPPGWPWLLAGFRAVRLETWAPALCAGLTVVATAVLAKRVVGPSAGLCAAMLLAACPEFLLDGSLHYAHAATALALVLAALSIVTSDSRPVLRWRIVVFGALVGTAITMRPVTGLAVGGSLAMWSLMRAPTGSRGHVQSALIAAAGAAPFVALLLWYQHQTTGSDLTQGYAAANGALHNLGFGLRGFLSPKGTGIPHVVASYFGWRRALIHLAQRAWDAGFAAIGGAPIAALLALGASFGVRSPIRWRPVAAFAPLPVAHVFFFYSDPRYYTELLPFLAVGLTFLIDRLGIDGRRRSRLLAVALVAGVAIDAVRAPGYRQIAQGPRSLYEAAANLSTRCGPLLIFASDSVAGGLSEPALEGVYWFNVEGLGGRVLAARDLGPLDTLLAAQYPARIPLAANLATPGFFSAPAGRIPGARQCDSRPAKYASAGPEVSF